MSTVLITGRRGTVGSALADACTDAGIEPVAWDRAQTPVDDVEAMQRLLDRVQPTVLFHLAVPSSAVGIPNEYALVNLEWPQHLARLTHERGIKLLFTSTAMVFTNDAKGPFTLESNPDATEGYGGEKRQAELSVAELNPDALIVRLGWQIGNRPGSNNMIDFFDRNQRESGAVEASTRWLPACSFLSDTAAALLEMSISRSADFPGGIYQLDGNPQWTFFEIASALSAKHGSPWTVRASDSFVYDQRMIDPRVPIKPIEMKLPELLTGTS